MTLKATSLTGYLILCFLRRTYIEAYIENLEGRFQSGGRRPVMYRKQERTLALVCLIVAAIMLYGAVKGYLRYIYYFG